MREEWIPVSIRKPNHREFIESYDPDHYGAAFTVEEASQYSNIGVNKISSLLNEPGCSFLFCVGKGKRLVKRKEFEKFIEKTLEV